MSVSSFSSAAKPGVCLSTDRPDSPFDGQVIYETDTNRTLVYDNSEWVVIADNQVLSIDSTNGRVGVGTASPNAPLEINGSINTELLRLSAPLTTSNQTNFITMVDSQDGDIVAAIGLGSDIGGANDNDGGISFATTTAASGSIPSTSMYINYAGNVGIGTTSPSYPLDVNGSARFTGSLYLTGFASVPVAEWQEYTPGLSTATLGNGSTTGYYMRVGNIIHAYARFDLGSTSGWDNRYSRISTPVTAKNSGSTSTQDNANIVQVEVNDSSAGLNYIMGGFIYDSGGNFRISGWRAIDATAGSGIRSGYFLDLSNDVTLGDGDSVIIKAIYMADD